MTIALARGGAEVEVICGSDQYATVEGAATDDPTASGVRIRRIPRLIGGDIHRLKLLRQLWFYACALPMLLFRRRPDLIVTQTNPPLVVPSRCWPRRMPPPAGHDHRAGRLPGGDASRTACSTCGIVCDALA